MAKFKRLLCLICALVICTMAFVACNDEDETQSAVPSSSAPTETPSSSEPPASEDDETEEVVTSIREGENMNSELGDGWGVAVPPNYQPQK